MAGGRITMQSAVNHSYSIVWSSTADTNTNSSSLKIIVQSLPDSLWSAATVNYVGYVTIDGNRYDFNKMIAMESSSKWNDIFEVTVTIPHNADGTKEVKINAQIDFVFLFQNYMVGIEGGTKVVVLDYIPHPSTITTNKTTVSANDVLTITINSGSADFRHSLRYSFNGHSGGIMDISNALKSDWLIPIGLYDAIPDSTKGQGTIICDTYLGSSHIGSTTAPFTLTTTARECEPVFAPIVEDGNDVTYALTGDRNILIQGYSEAVFAVNATARYGATIIDEWVMNGGSTNNSPYGDFDNVQSGLFQFRAEDSRGYIGGLDVRKDLIAYNKPTVRISMSTPTDVSAITFSIAGEWYNDSFGAVNNTIELQYRFKEASSDYGEWVTVATAAAQNYSIPVTITGIDYTKTYTLQARAIDKLETIETEEQSFKTTPVFDWGRDDFTVNVSLMPKGGIAGDSIELKTSGASYDLIEAVEKLNKAVKVMSTPYMLSPLILNGDYYSASGSVYLIGNMLRCQMSATRDSVTGLGDITNEKVCSFSIPHNGKIKSAFITSFSNGATGGVATFTVANATNENGTLKFDVNLAATGAAISNFSTYFLIPVTIDIDKYED